MPVAPNAPGFGTGAVDWGNYVGANQQTTDRDRAQVQGYLAGQPPPGAAATPALPPTLGHLTTGGPTVATGGGPNFGAPDYSAWAKQQANQIGTNSGTGLPVTPAGTGFGPTWGQPAALAPGAPDWQSMDAALATPAGFEQDLGAANHPGLITPFGSLPANDPTATGPGAGNGFDAALEGQNAQSLYNPGVAQTNTAPAAANPGFSTPAPVQRQTPNSNNVPTPQAPTPLPQGQQPQQQSPAEFQRYLKGIGK